MIHLKIDLLPNIYYLYNTNNDLCFRKSDFIRYLFKIFWVHTEMTNSKNKTHIKLHDFYLFLQVEVKHQSKSNEALKKSHLHVEVSSTAVDIINPKWKVDRRYSLFVLSLYLKSFPAITEPVDRISSCLQRDRAQNQMRRTKNYCTRFSNFVIYKKHQQWVTPKKKAQDEMHNSEANHHRWTIPSRTQILQHNWIQQLQSRYLKWRQCSKWTR